MSKAKDLLTDFVRLAVAAAMFAVVIYLVFLRLDVSGNILLVLLGFGSVITVHEFGHFIVAKLAGIKVEVFSIFMPPTLFGIRRTQRGWRIRLLPEILRKSDDPTGDGLLSFNIGRNTRPGVTEYRIGLIPFGGFVKMLGQDDIGPVKRTDDPRSYSNKPALIRAAVLAAGVTFNAISAVIVYIVVFLVGIGLPPPIIGGVVPGSPADRAGLKAGDEIIAIDGHTEHLDFTDVAMAAALSGRDEQIELTIRHQDGTTGRYSVAPEQKQGAEMRTIGVAPASTLRIAEVNVSDANLLMSRTGLRPGDTIRAVNGKDVQTSWQFADELADTLAPQATILAERKDPNGRLDLVEGNLNLFLPTTTVLDPNDTSDLANVCSLVPRIRIAGVSAARDSLLHRLLVRVGLRAKKLDTKPVLKVGDIVIKMADTYYPTYVEMRQITTAHEDRELSIEVLRTDPDGSEQKIVVDVTPRSYGTGRVVIGITPELDAEHAVVAKAIDLNGGPLEIPRGASIEAVDGVQVSSFYDVIRIIRQSENQRVTFDWRIDDQNAGSVAVDVGKWTDCITARCNLRDDVPLAPTKRLYKASGPLEAVEMGFKRTLTFIAQTYVTLQRLFAGLVSPKGLYGPVGILTFSYQIVASEPLIYYVYFLGLIGASVAVINFLPLPPFDGGLVVLLIVEKIRGKALSERTQGIIAYAGWLLVLALLIYVTRNDIIRSFF